MKKIAKVLAMAAISILNPEAAFSAQPTVGIENARVFQTMSQGCTKPDCESESMLPIASLTGTAATCIESGTSNRTYKLAEPPQVIQLYEYGNDCAFNVFVSLKINGQWRNNVGTIGSGKTVALGVVQDGSTGDTPSMIMFCKNASGPRDDLTCN